MLKTLTIILAIVVVALIAAAAGLAPAGAQGLLAKPAGVAAVDGTAAGTVTVSWDAVDGASFYRIGWVSADDLAAVRAEGRHWLDAFVFSDVDNRGQTSYTVLRLAPGVRHAFIVGSINSRFGTAGLVGVGLSDYRRGDGAMSGRRGSADRAPAGRYANAYRNAGGDADTES